MEDDKLRSNKVNDTRGNEAGSKDKANNDKKQVGESQECLLCRKISCKNCWNNSAILQSNFSS